VSQPYVGEIRIFAGNFAPLNWMFCQGQQLSISGNEALFNLIGTTYGGDGQNTFQLPDLRSRLPIHQGNGFVMGQPGGVEQVTLTVPQMPPHSHTLFASLTTGTASSPLNNVSASSTATEIYYDASATGAMGPNSILPTGGSMSHNNVQPYLCLDFIISLYGIYPTQS
jgi:microcystin-dependent protein